MKEMPERDRLAFDASEISRPTLVGRCPVCDRLYLAERPTRKYCSAACRVKASNLKTGYRQR